MKGSKKEGRMRSGKERVFAFVKLRGYQGFVTWPVDEIIEAFLRSGLDRSSSALEFLTLEGGSTLWRKLGLCVLQILL
ncbi:hypothetical protein WN51_05658 [Melipona quadrifasciata]|uniref:Uncharacterized protein n=1 Tax=Melipona quadrifasciata TaxID=166423 RepID=A0A0N0BDI6_9HYME|nr:hypothetical protein WN51_05658 [Melipona quadrifasciata]